LVPALVEQVHLANSLDPLRRRMVWCVRGARHVVAEERFVRLNGVELFHPANGIISHGGDQVPFRFTDVRTDSRGIAEYVGLPLAGVAAEEPIEVLKTHANGPQIERPSQARLEDRRVVGLPVPGRTITVVSQDGPDR